MYDLYDFQFTPLAPGAHTRLISGRNVQFSFATTDPDSAFRHHIHPEEQMMYVLRGEVDQIILDREEKMKAGDISEMEGMDSISHVQKTLQGYIHRSDSLVKTSTDRYWKFRNTYAEYQYNLRNLRMLYANELYQMLKDRSEQEKKKGK